ncbi:hypothetical protein NQ315_010152 [Exocentrus adspersus]|uniref:PAS domain-containing protein n=1 Tax=Exocentrus adspersus TaxID=1586481 RepID=A0AAV8WAG8_9CUCU|nr:hypothetical protein NQ315_010152 [Exocentrus adspersus]
MRFCLALSGFLMMMTQNGKLLYISDNAAEYLGHSMEDLLIHGDSVYDIIDKQDHQAIQCELGRPVNAGSNTSPVDEIRLFLCRMNVSRNARRQMRFGDQKVVLVQGRYLSFLPLCSRNEPVFLATCTPVAMPETRECVVQGATNVFTSIHSMDMRFIHIDNIKRKPKELQNLELDVVDHDVSDTIGGTSGLLVISHITERPRTLLKTDPSEIMDQWNPSPPWSDTLQKVPDLCHQELSPYIGSAPPTPTATPITQTGSAFSFDWMPEQYVPSMAAIVSGEDCERQIYWPTSEHRLFPLQPPPKRNHPPPGRSESADRDTP